MIVYPPSAMSTKEGFQFTTIGGFSQGLPCDGVVLPNTRTSHPSHSYDVIVIGAGYAGLVTARDLGYRGQLLDVNLHPGSSQTY
jgi:NADPH-dependent 2,4-dienoyl-CoA reductase/sulfur reductase-like enzyme